MLKTIEAISVGSFALRDPATGEFLPSVPLYIEATERAQESEKVLHREIAHIFAGKMRQYAEGCEMIGDKATADALRPDAGQPAESAAEPDKPNRKRGRPKK
ncbi:MAG: hypothetical protein HFH26_14895 [Clostridiaceae bacterium]|nr:hypothetical protein [Clostridiaceae bacterium]